MPLLSPQRADGTVPLNRRAGIFQSLEIVKRQKYVEVRQFANPKPQEKELSELKFVKACTWADFQGKSAVKFTKQVKTPAIIMIIINYNCYYCCYYHYYYYCYYYYYYYHIVIVVTVIVIVIIIIEHY